VEAVTPPFILVSGVPITREVLTLSAWFTPGGQSGLYTRLLIALDDSGVSSTKAQSVVAAVEDQAGAAGFGSGGGFGGSFGWKASNDMAVLLIPNVYRVAIEAESGGQAVTNVVGVQNSAGTALGAAQAVQTAWKVATGPLTQLSSLYALKGFRSLFLGSLNGDIAFVADASLGGTAISPEKATNASAALIKWNGGTRSRSSRGRMYLGPLRENDINADGRTLTPLRRTAFETAAAAFRTSLASGGYPLVVISPTTSTAFAVTSSAVETVIATQRRRIRS